MAVEDYEHSLKRIQLYKKGMNHAEITELFNNNSLADLENLKAVNNKMFQLINELENGNGETLELIHDLVEFLVKNDVAGNYHVNIDCNKVNGKWDYVIS
jgi:hypothetical protein